MALRFWVGGNGTWDNSSTANWATTSGGLPGASAPSIGDNVFFDSASGTGTATVVGSRVHATIIFSTLNISLNGSGILSPISSLQLCTGMTIGGTVGLNTNGTICSIFANGVTIPGVVSIASATSVNVYGNLVSSLSVVHVATPTLIFHGNVTAAAFLVASPATVRAVTMPALMTLTGTGVVFSAPATNYTLTHNNGTIKITDSSTSLKEFDGGSLGYYDLWFNSTGTGKLLIKGDNTFNEINGDSGTTFQFEAGSDNGTSDFIGNGVTLESDTGGSPFTITKLGGGSVSQTFTKVTDSIAAPNATTWYAIGGINGGGNTDWNFTLVNTAPVLDPIVLSSILYQDITLQQPTFATPGVPTPTTLAYIGIDGVIAIDPLTYVVTGYSEGGVDVSSGDYTFSSLLASTDYTVIVVSTNVAGTSYETVTDTTLGTAPVLDPLVTTPSYLSIDLTQPTFSVAGDPLPTVEAYIGLAGTIAIDPITFIVTGYTEGPIDVSSSGYTFASLAQNNSYTIIVVATNVMAIVYESYTLSTLALSNVVITVQNGIPYSPATSSVTSFTVQNLINIASGYRMEIPGDFYKLRGLDRSLGGIGAGDWLVVKSFNFAERNKMNRQVVRNLYGQLSITYRLFGDHIELRPEDTATGFYRMWYIPRYTPLVLTTDEPTGVMDFEEYIIVDAAIKCLAKEESDTSVLMAQKQLIMNRVKTMASSRDGNDQEKCGDVRNVNFDWEFPYLR